MNKEFYNSLEYLGSQHIEGNVNAYRFSSIVTEKDCTYVTRASLKRDSSFSNNEYKDIIVGWDGFWLRECKGEGENFTHLVELQSIGTLASGFSNRISFRLGKVDFVGGKVVLDELDILKNGIEGIDFIADYLWNKQSKYKARNGTYKVLNFARAVVDAVNAYHGVEYLEVKEKNYKDFIERTKEYIVYFYGTSTGDKWDYDYTNRIIAECYKINDRTNSNSCMTKGELFGIGSRVYDDAFQDSRYYHPFHAYRTEDWRFVFATTLPPEDVQGWDKESTPFRARAILHSYDEDWGYVKCYGSVDMFDTAYKLKFIPSDETLNQEICLYRNDYYDYVMPYVDGDCQTASIIDCSCEDEDGAEYALAVISDKADDNVLYGSKDGGYIAEQIVLEGYCLINDEQYSIDNLVWIDELDGYVHEEYCSCGELDAEALARELIRRNR